MKPKSPNWRYRGRVAGVAFLMLATVSANSYAATRSGEPFSGHGGKIALTAQQAAARAHLDLFLRNVVGKDQSPSSEAAVRISVRSDADGPRLLWVTDVFQSGSQFSGVQAGHSANPARIVHFERTQIVDWSFVGSDGRMYGNYGTRLVLATVNPTQAHQIAAILSENPTPREWFQ